MYIATVKYGNGEIGNLVCDKEDGSDIKLCYHNCYRSGICPHLTEDGSCDLEKLEVMEIHPYKRIRPENINVDGMFNLMTAAFRVLVRDYKNGDEYHKAEILNTIDENPIFAMAANTDPETLKYLIMRQAERDDD